MDPFVTVGTYYAFPAAYLAKARLESEGISAFVMDENVLTMQPLFGPAVGGIKLRVRECDAQAASAVLAAQPNEARASSAAETLTERSDDGFAEDAREALGEQAEENPADEPHDEPCPQCGSPHSQIVTPRLTFLAILLFGFPFGSAKAAHKCQRCGHKWWP